MKDKILVTGGAGYIGSFMVRALKEAGFTPIIIDNLSSGHEEAVKNFKLYRLNIAEDVRRLEEIFRKEKFLGVINMASYIQMGESFRNPAKYFDNNLRIAVNILNLMAKYRVPFYIFSSSAGVYGNPERTPINEEDRKEPVNPYGETKYQIERMLPWYDTAYGMKFVALRYFNAAGGAIDGSIGEDHPEESHLIPLAIAAALEEKEFTIFGKDYKTKDGTCERDYIHVLDLANAHVLALKYLIKGGKSEFVNAAVGTGYSNKQIVETIEKILGKKMNIKYGERRPGDADKLFASNSKIKKLLGWKPKYGLKEIIETAYKWHSNNPKGYIK
jgi:UDP-glucose 4-epimerase